ncbi:MAG TPA: ankyrin repeat domain-containing protein [Pseudonocardia sp.]|nr:ankyrin repeat domain-containing protein [Pseudonocardia sp.]
MTRPAAVSPPDGSLTPFCRAIAARDTAAALSLVTRELAHARVDTGDFWLAAIDHYVYGGDTALHVAAASHAVRVVRALIAAGADVAARNRRGAAPLHYAADGQPGAPGWDPAAQAEAVTALLQAGADPNATDKSGVTALHRAVRTRCAAAVAALLAGGADPARPNRSGSTPRSLATRTTGRGGSGSAAARAQQREILDLLGLPLARPSARP